ncbi:hypothetical protein SDC9_212917 [bioreactor metagenome]|uniref:Uncharacterized protein n=1 Tax=bioreactor metagenome TaxID=1076179 RepID=A0A645JN98_9ZZZZ
METDPRQRINAEQQRGDARNCRVSRGFRDRKQDGDQAEVKHSPEEQDARPAADSVVQQPQAARRGGRREDGKLRGRDAVEALEEQACQLERRHDVSTSQLLTR